MKNIKCVYLDRDKILSVVFTWAEVKLKSEKSSYFNIIVYIMLSEQQRNFHQLLCLHHETKQGYI